MKSVRMLTMLAVSAAAILAAAADSQAQVFRRDPAQEPAPLEIDGRTYKPDGDLNFWMLKFHGFASLRSWFDSNIFLEPPYRQEDDTVLSLLAGGRADWKIDRHETSLGYRADARAYARHSSQNYVEHRVDLLSQWNFDWFFVDFGERFSHNRNPSPTDLDIISDRSINDMWLRGGMYVDRIGFEIEYKWRWVDFLDRNLVSLDHQEHWGTIEAYYLLRSDSKMAQKVYAFVELTFGSFRFHQRFLSDSHQLAGYIGVKGTVFDRFAVTLKVGAGGIDPKFNGSTDEHEYFRGAMYYASVNYAITPEQVVSLSSFRQIQASLGSNYQVFDRLDASFKQTLFDNLDLTASVFFDHTDPSHTRSTTRMGTGLRAEYRFRPWMSFSAWWDFAWRTGPRASGQECLDYHDHKIGIEATVWM